MTRELLQNLKQSLVDRFTSSTIAAVVFFAGSLLGIHELLRSLVNTQGLGLNLACLYFLYGVYGFVSICTISISCLASLRISYHLSKRQTLISGSSTIRPVQTHIDFLQNFFNTQSEFVHKRTLVVAFLTVIPICYLGGMWLAPDGNDSESVRGFLRNLYRSFLGIVFQKEGGLNPSSDELLSYHLKLCRSTLITLYILLLLPLLRRVLHRLNDVVDKLRSPELRTVRARLQKLPRLTFQFFSLGASGVVRGIAYLFTLPIPLAFCFYSSWLIDSTNESLLRVFRRQPLVLRQEKEQGDSESALSGADATVVARAYWDVLRTLQIVVNQSGTDGIRTSNIPTSASSQVLFFPLPFNVDLRSVLIPNGNENEVEKSETDPILGLFGNLCLLFSREQFFSGSRYHIAKASPNKKEKEGSKVKDALEAILPPLPNAKVDKTRTPESLVVPMILRVTFVSSQRQNNYLPSIPITTIGFGPAVGSNRPAHNSTLDTAFVDDVSEDVGEYSQASLLGFIYDLLPAIGGEGNGGDICDHRKAEALAKQVKKRHPRPNADFDSMSILVVDLEGQCHFIPELKTKLEQFLAKDLSLDNVKQEIYRLTGYKVEMIEDISIPYWTKAKYDSTTKAESGKTLFYSFDYPRVTQLSVGQAQSIWAAHFFNSIGNTLKDTTYMLCLGSATLLILLMALHYAVSSQFPEKRY